MRTIFLLHNIKQEVAPLQREGERLLGVILSLALRCRPTRAVWFRARTELLTHIGIVAVPWLAQSARDHPFLGTSKEPMS
jgi:hypothetical protein